MTISNNQKSKIFIMLYAILAVVPLIVLILGPRIPGRSALLDLSIALAFGGLSLMALQFLLTARIKPINAPFGADIIYYFHRQIGIASFSLLLLIHCSCLS